MTWNEFKEEVEKQLKEKRYTGDEKIWYIDVSFPDPGDAVVHVDPRDNTMTIS